MKVRVLLPSVTHILGRKLKDFPHVLHNFSISLLSFHFNINTFMKEYFFIFISSYIHPINRTDSSIFFN